MGVYGKSSYARALVLQIIRMFSRAKKAAIENALSLYNKMTNPIVERSYEGSVYKPICKFLYLQRGRGYSARLW
jgi:hypothetical protein